MRHLLFALVTAAFAAGPSLAQSWGHYENARYGYSLSIPPDFEGQGESDNGDGQAFTLESRVAVLTTWGGLFVTEPDFESEAKSRLKSDLANGWGLTSQSTTTTWASWSATKPGRVLHQHMLQLCDGASYAALRLEYAQVDRRRLDPLIEPLIASFEPVC